MRYWDGSAITYGAGKPLVTLHINSPKAVRAIFTNMTLGFGESYMRGLIEVDGPLDGVAQLVAQNKQAFGKLSMTGVIGFKNWNRKDTQKSQIQRHYDLGNDFYKLWLDTSMTYSCAYFRTPKDTLEKAQQQKVELLLRKLQLKKGQQVLDIGCGWGTLLIKAAQEYGVSGLGITLSQQQFEHATAEAKRLGLDKKIHFELVNYQDLAKRGKQYDRIISVGMYEHVGRNNQKQYFKAVDTLLKPSGVSVLHTISNQDRGGTDPWMDKYIFPGGYIPAIQQIVNELPSYDFHMIDYENLRIHYAMTLDEWWKRFEKHKDTVIKRYGQEFYRMWRLYLASCAANFRYGDLELSQVVFVKGINNELPLTREHLCK